LGHELGHFLMPSHVPDDKGRFLCSKNDMSLLRQRPEIRAPQSDLWVRWSSSSRDGIRRP
jgi:hypothetical protein